MNNEKIDRRAFLTASAAIPLAMTTSANAHEKRDEVPVVNPSINGSPKPKPKPRSYDIGAVISQVVSNQYARFARGSHHLSIGDSVNAAGFCLAATPLIVSKLMKYDFMNVTPLNVTENVKISYLGARKSQPPYEVGEDPNALELVVYSDSVQHEKRNTRYSVNFNEIVSGYTTESAANSVILLEAIADGVAQNIARNYLTSLRNISSSHRWDFRSSPGDTLKQKYESLYIKIAEISFKCAKEDSLGRGCNWIITSPEVASIFETATAFEPSVVPERYIDSYLDITLSGTLNHRWKVYKDPLYPTNSLMMGHRGDNPLHALAHYCPLTVCNVNEDSTIYTEDAHFFAKGADKVHANLAIENFLI